MEKLYPVATPTTRHLFVDPAIYQPFDIVDPHYGVEQTSYIKPGKIPNLMALCAPSNVQFSTTEEPDPDNIIIQDILFGMWVQGDWKVYRTNLNTKIIKLNASNWGLDGWLSIPTHTLINVNTGERGIQLSDTNRALVSLNINYSRGDRCLGYSTEGTYDNGKPQILGLCLGLTYKDSKSPISLFKSTPKEIVQTYRREIVA